MLALYTNTLRISSPPTPQVTANRKIRLNPTILDLMDVTLRYMMRK